MLPHFEDYGHTVQNGAPLWRRFRFCLSLYLKVAFFSQQKTPSVAKAFEIGHRWQWGPHFCAEEYGVASDNVDGGGKDVCEKNEIISVVTTKREDARLVTIIDLFAYTLVTLRQTRGALRGKNRLAGTKGRHLRCSNAFHALRSKFSRSFMFFSPLFFRLLDAKHLRRRGKNTTYRFAFPWNFHAFDGFHWQPYLSPAILKSFRECVVKAGMQVFFFFCLVWDGKVCAGLRTDRGENYFFVLLKDSTIVSCWCCRRNMLFFSSLAALAAMFEFISQPCVLLLSIEANFAAEPSCI